MMMLLLIQLLYTIAWTCLCFCHVFRFSFVFLSSKHRNLFSKKLLNANATKPFSIVLAFTSRIVVFQFSYYCYVVVFVGGAAVYGYAQASSYRKIYTVYG